MNRIIISSISGTLFGVGLGVSEMINPRKVQAILDVSGNWDPSLAFVLLGALLVTTVTFRLILKRDRPIFEHHFKLPTKQELDLPLSGGAALFGIGWGMTGYCPGPAIAGIGLGLQEAIIMVLAVIAGFHTHRLRSGSQCEIPGCCMDILCGKNQQHG